MGKPAAGAMPSAPCTVKIEHENGTVMNGPYRADNSLAQGATHHNDRHNHYANLAGCQGHQVITAEHDTNVDRNQVWTFHTGNGRTSLERNWNGFSAIMINRIPLDKSEYMVGFAEKTSGTKICNNQSATVEWVNNRKGELCPGGTFYALDCNSGLYACAYDKNETDLRDQVPSAIKADMINRVCNKTENLDFKISETELCAHQQQGKAIAIEYCETGDNFTSDMVVCTPNGLSSTGGYGDLLKWHCGKAGNIKTAKCDVTINADDNKLARTDYDTLATAFCNTPTGRADTFCKCHNVTSGVCDANPTAAGCPKKKETFDKLVAATPSDQKDVWSGMEACFGRVCTGTGIFMPPNVNQNCDKSVNVCIQDIDIGSMTDSNITPVCDIKSGDGSPSVSEPSAAQDSAKSELDEAKAAVARGDDGAQERLDAAEAALDAADESAGETGPKAYIPKSLDGLKNDRKQQIGAGAMGALVLGCMMMLLLIVASASGGGGGPAKRRFR
jgi:hypothetical protein